MISLGSKRTTFQNAKADILACLVFEDQKVQRRQISELKQLSDDLSHALDAATFQGKEKETLLLFPKGMRSKRLLLVGLGKLESLSLEKIRRGASLSVKTAASHKAASVGLMEPDPEILATTPLAETSLESVGVALAEGAALGAYRYDRYLSDKDKNSALKQFLVLSNNSGRLESLQKGIRFAQIVCEGTYLARDLANAPGNEIYPETLARQAVLAGRKTGFRVAVLDERKIRSLKMGGLLGVSQGSAQPPRFIIMEHNGRNRRMPTVVLVGKGVTFDAGGISIKPAQGMAEMKMDMSGAAAVIGTMYSAARLQLPLRMIGLIPATENLLGGAAMKPGDILTHHGGKTSEVDNTDAEGRLILADALSFASKYKPDLVIDLATLTGACVVALGSVATGMMGNDQTMMDRLKDAGERTYERVWQLPLYEEYEKLIKSDIADVKNVGGRWAGAITGALFLKKFIGSYKWIHLDIAGTAMLEEAHEYLPKGGSGVGVRLLVDFLRHWKEN